MYHVLDLERKKVVTSHLWNYSLWDTGFHNKYLWHPPSAVSGIGTYKKLVSGVDDGFSGQILQTLKQRRGLSTGATQHLGDHGRLVLQNFRFYHSPGIQSTSTLLDRLVEQICENSTLSFTNEKLYYCKKRRIYKTEAIFQNEILMGNLLFLFGRRKIFF